MLSGIGLDDLPTKKLRLSSFIRELLYIVSIWFKINVRIASLARHEELIACDEEEGGKQQKKIPGQILAGEESLLTFLEIRT